MKNNVEELNNLMTVKELKNILSKYIDNSLLYCFHNNIKDVQYVEEEGTGFLFLIYNRFNRNNICTKKYFLDFVKKNQIKDDVYVVGCNDIVMMPFHFNDVEIILDSNINLTTKVEASDE